MSNDESSKLTKIGSLERYSRNIDTIVKVVSKNEPRVVTSRRDMSTHTVCEALIGDETGSIYLTLWDNDVENILEGQILSIKNAYVNMFRGSMRLNIGRQGSYELFEGEPFEEVNLDNNLSGKIYEQYRDNRRPFRRRRRY